MVSDIAFSLSWSTHPKRESGGDILLWWIVWKLLVRWVRKGFTVAFPWGHTANVSMPHIHTYLQIRRIMASKTNMTIWMVESLPLHHCPSLHLQKIYASILHIRWVFAWDMPFKALLRGWWTSGGYWDFVNMEFTNNLWGPNVFLHLNRDWDPITTELQLLSNDNYVWTRLLASSCNRFVLSDTRVVSPNQNLLN